MSYLRKIYLCLKTGDLDDVENFFKIYDNYVTERLSDRCLKVEVHDNFDYSEFVNAREILIEELFIDFVAFVSPINFDYNINLILETLPDLSPGIYAMADFIFEITILNKKNLMQSIKNYYYNLLNHETINTVLGFIEQNMNASSAAKKMFMHRNTLNYRLDHFIEKTEINVKQFKEAMAVYILFNR